jgi:hypothetical protein
MANVSWDSEGVIRIDFLPHGVTLNAQYYSNLLCSDVHTSDSEEMIWETVKDYHPTAWQCSSTNRTFGKGEIGNNELGNHEPPSLQP